MEATRRAWWPSIVAVLIVAMFGLYLWAWNDAQTAFGDVRVVTDATALRCSGIEPGYVEGGGAMPESFTWYRIELRPNMECEIEFHVQNTGSREVDLDQLIIPNGAVGAQGALAVRIDWNSLGPSQGEGARDAEFDLDVSLRPDEHRSFSVFVTFQEGLCLGNDATTFFEDYARLELSRWVFDGSPGNTLVPIAFTGVGETDC